MCTANSNTANQAQAATANNTAKTPFYNNPTFWRSAGTGLAIGAGAMSAMGAYSDGRAQAGQYKAEAATLEANAEMAERAALRQVNYDLQTAKHEVKQVRRAGRQTYAKQLAAAVANGMDFSSVSLQDVIADSHRAEQEDIDLIKKTATQRANETRLQAELNSITAKSQANQARIAARYAKKAGRLNAYSSMLSTAATVAGMWGGAK